ncbi:radical SAM protein [Caulobacter sp. NIBR1757]|uniref:radical SAM protein n=1 Tax=Caulobacter sp. NIBR1757 TaxID=3016000 RepID=UPI0022F0D362|nr:radical SAM protein [Caulobacter sp. NIBR1757]
MAAYAPLPEVLSQRQALGFVVKVAERCNIACSYCYFFFHGDQTYREHPAYISEATCDGFVDYVAETASTLGLKTVTVGLHGGEPLMAPKARIDEFCRKLRELPQRTALETVSITLQSNGMLIDQEWIEIFRRHRVAVGISLDGPKEKNDRARIDKRGRGTYDRTISGYQRLVGAAHRGEAALPGLLGVMDPELSGRDVARHFVEELKCRHLNFLTPDIHFDDPIATAKYIDGVGRFMIEVFRYWVELDDPEVSIRFIDEISNCLQSDDFARQARSDAREYRHLFTISSNGDIGPEDTIKTVAPRFRGDEFNISRSTIADVLGSSPWEEIGRARFQPPERCKTCEWWGVCRGGSITNRYSEARGFDNPSVFCSALQAFYGEVAAWLVESGVNIERILDRLHAAHD